MGYPEAIVFCALAMLLASIVITGFIGSLLADAHKRNLAAARDELRSDDAVATAEKVGLLADEVKTLTAALIKHEERLSNVEMIAAPTLRRARTV